MFISELNIDNYKGFKSKNKIKFSEGMNVLIGHNNAGKTTVIEALRLLFDVNMSKNLKVDDFYKGQDIDILIKYPPEIIISAKLEESENEEEYSDDLVVVSTWLNKIEKPYEAIITYKFYLPEKEHKSYRDVMQSLSRDKVNEYWDMLEENFLRKYTWKLYGGNVEYQNTVDSDTIKKFDFQFLNAIRDVERDLFTGKNTLLKEVIDFFMDYDIKTSHEEIAEKQKRILALKKDFSSNSNKLIESLQTRMESGKKEMLKYVKDTGASIGNNVPGFDGKIMDTELYSALRLVVEDKTGIKLPVTQNGLGYNNLIFISLLLAKMQKNASGDYLGSNAKVYSMLAIEEPEAHLHPNMQYKFLKFLNENKSKEVRQIFITSHSANITAAVSIDNIVILSKNDKEELKISYPGKVFDSSNPEDIKSKYYVKRFIDVTKADMFFSKKIIFVEGIAEQLLIPEFAKLLGYDLIDNHVSVINVGGRYFKHFLKLFDINANSFAIDKKVACITDLDPIRSKKINKDIEEEGECEVKEQRVNEACLPLFLNCDNEKYEYSACSNGIVGEYSTNKNIKIFTQEKWKSCTLEYDIILHNSNVSSIITESVSNRSEILKMIEGLNYGKNADDIVKMIRGKSKFKTELMQYMKSGNLQFDDDELKRQIIASRYLKSIKKGEVAQELASVISEQVNEKNSTGISKIKVPKYIEEAIVWICQ